MHIAFDLLQIKHVSVAHYTLQAKSCVFVKQKKTNEKFVSLLYCPKIPMGRAITQAFFTY